MSTSLHAPVRSFPRARVPAAVAVSLALSVAMVVAVAPGGAAVVEASGATGFTPVDPTREVDTRLGKGGQRLRAGEERFVPLRSVPHQAAAVTINVTVAGPRAEGFLTVTDCRRGGSSSAVNFVQGRVTPNQVTVGVSVERGQRVGVCMTASQDTDVIVDLFGYMAGSGRAAFSATTRREHDTRTQGGVGSDGVLRVDVGRHTTGGPIRAWSGTVTVTGVASPGYVTVYACADPRPGVSNLNLTPGVTKANQVTVQMPANDPRVCVYRDGAGDIVVDTTGVWRDDPSRAFTATSPPARIIDTRSGTALAAGEVRRLHTERNVVLFLNVTATRSSGDGWVALFPCGEGYQQTSSLNLVRGEDVSSAVTVGAGNDGVCVTGSVDTDVVVDVFGTQHRAGSSVDVAPGVPLAGSTLAPGNAAPEPATRGGGRCHVGSLGPFNDVRIARGLPALVSDARTEEFACAWAAEMATAGRMFHSTPDRRSGIDACGITGENVANGGSNWSWMPEGWLNSPPHLSVIVHPLLTRASVAYVEGTVDGRPTWFGVTAFGGRC